MAFLESPLGILIVLVLLGACAGLAFVLLVGRKPAERSRPAAPAPSPSRAASAPITARPAGKLSVAAIVEQLARVGDDETTFLDRKTGRFITLRDELLAALQGNEALDTEDHPDASDLDELRAKLRAKVLVQLPTKAQTKEFLLRERFCETLPEGSDRETMTKVLRAQTGFRSFESAVTRLNLERQWHHFRDAEFARIAADWLQRNRLLAA